MSEQNHIEKCQHCNGELLGSFCANCGRPKKLVRINGPYILSEIASVLNFEKGLLFTIKELLIRPGLSIKRFIHEDRNELVKPINFIILCSLIYILTQQWLQFDDGYMNYSDLFDGNKTAISSIMSWISNNYGLANILLANFIAFWVQVFFHKYGYNIFEILVLLYFVMGIQMLLLSIFGTIESISNLSILDPGVSISILYVCWAIASFFDRSRKINYLKSIFSYMLGLLSFIFIAMVCGVLIDLILA